MKSILFLIIFSISFTSSCHRIVNHSELITYNRFSVEKDQPFLVILVDAPHLDYRNSFSFCRSLIKSKERRFGHAWIYLQGMSDGNLIQIEGGHSGELGILQPKYFDGIMNYIDYGYANPTPDEIKHPKHEPNPVKYLWANLEDGFFQEGSGGHKPTYAVKINLTDDQFQQIYHYIENYNFKDYSIREKQCCTFVIQAAAIANLKIESEITMPIGKNLKVGGRTLKLWSDPGYSTIRFSCPDALEKSLIQAVKSGLIERY